MNKMNFTKTVIAAISPAGKIAYYYDAKQAGLMLMVSPAGAKTYYLQRRIAGQFERIKLGKFETMTVEQARTAAAKLNGAIAAGANPAEAKRVARAEPTFGDVLTRFLQEKRSNKGRPLGERTKSEYQRIATRYLGALLSRRMSEVRSEVAKAVHRKIASDADSNKARALLSTVFNFAADEGIADLPNPASGISLRHVESRDRWLQHDELPQFFAALESSPLRDFFLLALLTGARRSNLQAMRWQDVDLDSAVWHIPLTKNGTPQNVILAPEAVTILRERLETRTHGETFVFPGDGKTGHLVEPKTAWAGLLKRAGIENLRIHDLRRTLGSWQARQGASLVIIGKSLNHKTQQATAIYARLDLDPVRQSVNNATAAMLKAAGVKHAAEVLPIRRKR